MTAEIPRLAADMPEYRSNFKPSTTVAGLFFERIPDWDRRTADGMINAVFGYSET